MKGNTSKSSFSGGEKIKKQKIWRRNEKDTLFYPACSRAVCRNPLYDLVMGEFAVYTDNYCGGFFGGDADMARNFACKGVKCCGETKDHAENCLGYADSHRGLYNNLYCCGDYVYYSICRLKLKQRITL